MKQHVRRLAILAALAGSAFWLTATPAAAGGSWLNPIQDRYEPGETVELVGYASAHGSLGAADDGPFSAYLQRFDMAPTAPSDFSMAPFIPGPSHRAIGQLRVEAANPSAGGYRVSIEFEVPDDVVAGLYSVVYCNATCTKGLTDLIGAQIFVGIDPTAPVIRSWPLDEPAIADLRDDARLSGPYGSTTAGDVRAGIPPTPIGGAPSAAAVEPATTAASSSREPRTETQSATAAQTSPVSSTALLLLVLVATLAGVLFFLRRRTSTS